MSESDKGLQSDKGLRFRNPEEEFEAEAAERMGDIVYRAKTEADVQIEDLEWLVSEAQEGVEWKGDFLRIYEAAERLAMTLYRLERSGMVVDWSWCYPEVIDRYWVGDPDECDGEDCARRIHEVAISVDEKGR